MMHWNLKRDLQIPLWNVKVRCMYWLLLVRSQGGYHHVLPLIGHHLLLNTQLGEPEFETVYNPGQWSEFNFRPVFAKLCGMYIIHDIPTGFMPLPQDSSDTRRRNWWEFHYNDWDNEVGPHRIPVDDAKNSLLSAKDVLAKTCCGSWVSQSTVWLCKMISSSTIFDFRYVMLTTLGLLIIPGTTTSVMLKISPLATYLTLDS